MFCASCGAKQVDEAKFCVACGAKIKTAADQRLVERDVAPLQNEIDRPKILRPSLQPLATKSSSVFNTVLGSVLIASVACVIITYFYERAQPGSQQQTPNAQNPPQSADQGSLVNGQPATSVEAAWEPYIKYAPCMASNGSLMQTFINNGVYPTDRTADVAIAACQ